MTRKDVGQYVYNRIAMLQSDSSWSRSTMAKLRRGLGKPLEESPDSWEFILSDMPEGMAGKGTGNFKASYAENAAHVAITLYALHQQGNSESMNQSGRSFATAMGDLMLRDKNATESLKKRFDSVITSTDIDEMSNHIRGIVHIMKSRTPPIKFDYPLLAEDLYSYQFSDSKERILFRWATEFYRTNNLDKKKNERK